MEGVIFNLHFLWKYPTSQASQVSRAVPTQSSTRKAEWDFIQNLTSLTKKNDYTNFLCIK